MNTNEELESMWNKLNATMDRLANTLADSVIERVQANLQEKMLDTAPVKKPRFYCVDDMDDLMSALHTLADGKSMAEYEVNNDEEVDTETLINFYMQKDDNQQKH